jgi:hypothetical protein
MAGLKKRSPRLKVTTDANNVTKIAPDHPDLGIAQLALMKAIGTSDSDFSNGLICQLVDASTKRSGLQCRAPAVRGAKVCRMHGAGGGASKRNRNALKHGAMTAEARALRRETQALVRMAAFGFAGASAPPRFAIALSRRFAVTEGQAEFFEVAVR